MKYMHKITQQLFHLFGGRAEVEDLLGDLDEVYYSSKERSNRLVATWNYWRHVCSLLLSYALRRRAREASYSPYYQGVSAAILKSYLKVSLRNLKQQRTFTFLNVVGLSTGMSIALLALAMFIELQNFDTFHPHAEEIYQLNTQVIKDGNTRLLASTPPALTYAADEKVSDILASVHINDDFFPVVKKAGNELALRGLFTSPDFFNVFAMPLKEGTVESLSEPDNVIITEELALRLFGEAAALGKVIQTENWGSLKVSGVLEKFPKRTHLRFELLTGFQTSAAFNARHRTAQWTDFKSNYYFMRIADEKKELVLDQLERIGLTGQPAMDQANLSASFQLRPLTEINPGISIEDEFGLVFDKQTMWFFFGIALLILFPACFNYSNLSITRALKRAREIGIRKVIGSQKKQIMEQFLVETVLVSLISVALATVLFHLIRAEFISMLVGASALSFEITPQLLLIFGLFALVTGILTGLIPGAYFAKISPLAAMRNGVEEGKVSISGIRKGLLVVQFALTLGFMMGIGVLAKQYFTVLNYQTGFNKENIAVLPLENHNPAVVRSTFESMPEVSAVSFSSSIPGTSLSGLNYAYFTGGLDSVRYRQLLVDDHFTQQLDLDFVWGQGLDDKHYQKEQVLVNETFMAKIQNLKGNGDSLLVQLANHEEVVIVGVLKDYNHEPLNERIEPLLLKYAPEKASFALLTVATPDMLSTVSNLEAKWDQLFPETIFNVKFLEQEIEDSYEYLRTGMKILGFLAILALVISCLGLLGMVIYLTENRTKEVAIRKILGASYKSLLANLSGMFFKMWGIAILIAVPIAYLIFDKFMLGLFNKFNEGVGIAEILLSLLLTLGLGVLAILWQTHRVVNVNPSENLRNE